MSLSSKVILSFIAGTVSALLAWVVVDFNGFYSIEGQPATGMFMQVFMGQAFMGVVFGLFVGVGIGAVNGLSKGSGKQLRRDLGWGAVIGLVGGLLGLFFGQMFFGQLYRGGESGMSILGPIMFLWNVLIRAIGWAFIGTFLGLAQGVSAGSVKAARHGAIGGFIGGLLGGTLFEVVPYILPPGTQSVGVVSRAISMTVTGAFIGFFIGLVEALMKQAWVRVVQGRNEGREYILSKARSTIGRDELSDIGLYGDRSVSPLHAVIESAPNGRHMLRDAGNTSGTSVNGQKVTEHLLRDGEVINIGSMRLEFHEKATASKVAPRKDTAQKPPVRIPASANICPFCGGAKDPSTGACACTVGSAPADQLQPPTPWPSAPTVTAPTIMPGGGAPRLVGNSGTYVGQSFYLSPSGTTTVGRETGRDIQLPMDTTVSRRHARIVNEAGTFVVYDEGSSNGTTVNGMPVATQPLSPGDVVSFGTAAFRFEN